MLQNWTEKTHLDKFENIIHNDFTLHDFDMILMVILIFLSYLSLMNDAPREFSKCSKYFVLMDLNIWPELFKKKKSFQRYAIKLPCIMERSDSLLDSKGANLT